jgi:uncharacterized protein YoxC
MDPDVMAFAQVSAIIIALAGSLSVITVGLVRALQPKKRSLPTDQVEQRLDHLQQSVDAIAVEVERITEAQRFTAKLLAEREETPRLKS